MSVIELRGLSKVFPNGVAAVEPTDLTVRAGEFFALVGPSGSGKSTLLRLVAGLETPTAGTVVIGGRDVTRLAPRDRDVSMVFQEPALYPYLSVSDNLAFGLRARRSDRAEIRERVAEVAASLGLIGVLDRRPQTLSGGQRQRVALGRAIARRRAVFLFDEPLSSLDAPLRASVRGDLIALHRALGATMIYVTHDQAEALAMGDRVGVMERGRVVQVGTPGEVYRNPATRSVAGFVGSPPMALIPCNVLEGDGSVRIVLDAASFLIAIDIPNGCWSQPLAARRGKRVELGVRPEHVAIARPNELHDAAYTWLPIPGGAEVTRVEFLGHETVVTLGLAPYSFSTRLPGPTAIRPGERFDIGLNVDLVSWFEASGDAILP